MLSLKECRKYIGDEMTDEKVTEIRDALYGFAEDVLDKHLFSGSVALNKGHEKETKTD